MRSIGQDPLELLDAGLSGLVETDYTEWDDGRVRAAALTLLTAFNQVGAVIASVLAVFDARGLAKADACRTTRAWLMAFTRQSPAAATGWWSRTKLLRDLPALRDGALTGAVSAEHLRKVADLVERLDLATVAELDTILADLAATATPADLQQACARIVAHADPDGAQPDPKAAFDRRGLTVSRSGSMVALRGQLDPEAGASLLAALNACSPPPARDDYRTAAQRRADALTDLVRRQLDQGELPLVQSVRPHLGVLLTPETLLSHCVPSPGDPGALRAADTGGADGPGRAGDLGGADPPAGPHHDLGPPPHRARDALAEAGVPPLPEPPWLDWFGDVPAAIAQRISCDCDVWRAVLDPATGLPLEVGRAHRLVPNWIRKALHARDRGCRWPGCTAPVAWADAHHLLAWYLGGETNVDNLLSLCRFHHVTVHEGRWTIRVDRRSGEVYAYRPDGSPYELNPSRPHTTDRRRAA